MKDNGVSRKLHISTRQRMELIVKDRQHETYRTLLPGTMHNMELEAEQKTDLIPTRQANLQ